MIKKITNYIKDGGITLNLRDPLVLTHESKLFVKTAAVFWNYKNVRTGYNDYISVNGKKVMMDEGYWTFKQPRKKMEENGLTFKEDIHDGLRYITVSCDLVNREHNIGPDGKRSIIITSLPIDGTKPLFGTVTKEQ